VIVNNLENPDPTPIDGPLEIISNNNPDAPGNSFSSIVLNENLRTVTDFAVLGSEMGVTYRINDGADKDLFWINPETGVLSFKEAPDWENPQDAEGDNNYEVNVLAERNGQFDAQFLTVTVANVDDANAPDPVSVYLIGGQSNAVGEALLSNLPAPYINPFPRAKIWGAPSESFVTLAPGFDGQTTNVGPEFSFGRTIVDRTNQDVYLVKYGLGATSLDVDWNPSGAGGGKGRQFNTFVDTVNQALDTLTTNGITYELDGLVWQQGESDTYDDGFADRYQDNLTNFIGTVRDFYGADLEVSIGLIRNDLPTSDDNRKDVRDAQIFVSGADPKVNLVDTDMLGPASTVLIDGDPTHYSAAGQVALGNAYGNSFAI
ncbi:MAG: sialate O-acetylesterase, partial [Cyanobacteria bacterium P01_F01_bin.53]